MTNNFEFEADMTAKTIHIVREFNAPVEKVWKAWTEPDLLEKWIAPKPWKVKTRTLDFTVGGIWLYVMISPEGRKNWVYAKFTAIEEHQSISTIGMYCDEDANPIVTGPKTYRETKFSPLDGNRSKVDMVISFEQESTLKMFVDGGFKAGMAMTLEILDQLLASE